jgi:putative phosphoribosyl transferase
MYFASRVQAGRMLASQLLPKYRYENCAVVALNDGGVMIGAQIAQQLHCVLMLLLSAEINLPLEPVALAGITASGEFAFNEQYSAGEIEELSGEYRNFVEQEKLKRMHDLNRLLGSGGTIKKELLKAHNIILVADGMKSGFILDLAYQFLKPIAIEKLVVATPLASVKAVDRMHVVADDLYCLNVVEDYIDTDHYYDKHDIPDHKTIIETIERIILNWK